MDFAQILREHWPAYVKGEARRQQARLLPAPYYLLTLTVPEQLRAALGHYPADLHPIFFAAVAGPVRAVCAKEKYLGGESGFIAVLHTWTRRMLFHPHIHVLIPAVVSQRTAARCAIRATRSILFPSGRWHTPRATPFA